MMQKVANMSTPLSASATDVRVLLFVCISTQRVLFREMLCIDTTFITTLLPEHSRPAILIASAVTIVVCDA